MGQFEQVIVGTSLLPASCTRVGYHHQCPTLFNIKLPAVALQQVSQRHNYQYLEQEYNGMRATLRCNLGLGPTNYPIDC